MRKAQAGDADGHHSLTRVLSEPRLLFSLPPGPAQHNLSLNCSGWELLRTVFRVLSPISVCAFWRSFSEVCLGGFCLFYGILKLSADAYSLCWVKCLQPLAKSEWFLSNLRFCLLQTLRRERYFESKLVVWKLYFEGKTILLTATNCAVGKAETQAIAPSSSWGGLAEATSFSDAHFAGLRVLFV